MSAKKKVAKKKKRASRTAQAHLKQPDFRDYQALQFTQRKRGSIRLIMFHAPAEQILSWSSVGVLGPDTQGHQRETKQAKIEAVKKFFTVNDQNLIPTAVVVAFSKGAAKFTATTSDKSSGTISIRNTPTSANIVDGQHRVYGMRDFDPSTQVPIVALLDVDDVEKAFQFMVINNKSTRVAATHAKALLAQMKTTPLAERLREARISFDSEGIRDVDILNSDKDSPFYKLVDWTITEEASRTVQATAIEASLAYLSNLNVPELEDRDLRRNVFATVWKTVKKTWPEQWTVGSRLLSKVGVVCLTRFVIDTITKWSDSDLLKIDLSDPDDIARLTADIVKYIDPRFWTQPWAATASGGFDTNQGRERVVKALTQVYRNLRRGDEWFTDIDIIDPATKPEGDERPVQKPAKKNKHVKDTPPRKPPRGAQGRRGK